MFFVETFIIFSPNLLPGDVQNRADIIDRQHIPQIHGNRQLQLGESVLMGQTQRVQDELLAHLRQRHQSRVDVPEQGLERLQRTVDGDLGLGSLGQTAVEHRPEVVAASGQDDAMGGQALVFDEKCDVRVVFVQTQMGQLVGKATWMLGRKKGWKYYC